MKFERLAEELIQALGGESNVNSLVHCATRLRFTLVEEERAEDEKVKEIDGILGISKNGGQYQVIIGNEVGKAYAAIQPLLHMDNKKVKENKRTVIETIFEFISSVFSPILPAIIGAGLIKSILAIAVLLGMATDGKTYYFLNLMGDAPLYFLPVMIAFTASKKLGCNQFLAVAIAGCMIHPNYTALITDAYSLHFTTFLGMPVTLATYSASVIPPILMVFALYFVEKLVDKIIPKMFQFFFKPVICILGVATVSFVILGPLGFIIGTGICTGLNFIGQYAGWLVPTLMGAFAPLMIIAGMHYGLVPFMMQSLAAQGFETISGPGQLPSNIAQGAASLALGLRSKNKELRKTALTVGTTAVLGVTEPALFSITLKYKRILTSVMIGGAVGGFYAGIMGTKCYAFCSPGLLSLATYIGPDGLYNITHSVISLVISFVLTFALVWAWGYKETIEKEEKTEDLSISTDKVIASPIKGTAVLLSEVPDATFAEEILGKGIAIIPSEGIVKSPVDGVVEAVFDTKHAYGLMGDNGVELLIHVGLDTVNLNGKFFDAKVQVGDRVKKGDILAVFELDEIKNAGYQIITPLVVANSGDYEDVQILRTGNISAGNELLCVK